MNKKYRGIFVYHLPGSPYYYSQAVRAPFDALFMTRELAVGSCGAIGGKRVTYTPELYYVRRDD